MAKGESYVSFFSYLYTAKLKAPVVREVKIAIYTIGVYECRFDHLQTSRTWIESDRKTESFGQKAKVNTSFDMIVLSHVVIYIIFVSRYHIGVGVRIVFVLTQRGNEKVWRNEMKRCMKPTLFVYIL